MKGFRKEQFKKFVQSYSLKGKKIVEIGCGRGEYLSIMNSLDVAAYGVEDSQESVADCIKDGLKVSQGFIDNKEYEINGAPFDAFFMMSFLEHLPDPNVVVEGIRNNLADNAIGLVEVPNFDMIVRSKLFSEFISDHLFYFTQETLKNTLTRNGFEILECDQVWHDYIISAVVKKSELPEVGSSGTESKKLDLSALQVAREKLQEEMEKYINNFKSVAIWGAGHQSLAVIALLGLKDKIKYVVDSAPFKQNKFTPATHIPIVSPSALETDVPDAIIVMAASYSDEVAGILENKFGKRIDIAILRDYGLGTAS